MTDTSSGGDYRELPQRLYLDTQFCFVYHVREDTQHGAARVMADGLKVLAKASVAQCCVSILALDELTWKLAGVFYDREHGEGCWRETTGRRSARPSAV